jgi:glucosamine 6-phosphate synthetase-like amidotransferase/phosphosugar isomerase protein
MDVLSLSATIFGFVALAGGAAGYFKASRGDSIIKYQATEIALRDAKVANLEKDLAKTTESCSLKDKQIEQLTAEKTQLQKMAQGSPMLKKIDAKLSKLLEGKGK